MFLECTYIALLNYTTKFKSCFDLGCQNDAILMIIVFFFFYVKKRKYRNTVTSIRL